MALTRSKGKGKKPPAVKAKTAKSKNSKHSLGQSRLKPKQGKADRIEAAFRTHGLSNIKMIDSDIDNWEIFWEKWSPRFDHLYTRVAKVVPTRANSTPKAFVYLQQEVHYVDFELEIVPVAIVVLCENDPTLSIVRTATKVTDMFDNKTEMFDNNGLSWSSVDPNLSILVESGDRTNSQGTLMNLRKPSEMDNEQPNQIGAYQIQYGTNTYEWQPDCETLSELLKNECPVEDRDAVTILFQEEKQRSEAEAVAKVRNNQAVFTAMVNQIAENAGLDDVQVRENLEAMKVYKIFPTGLPQPQTSPFGEFGGFRYELTVNRFKKADAPYYIE